MRGKHGTYIHITYKSVYSNNGPNISQTNRHDSSRMVSILPKWRQDVVKGRHTSGGSSHIPRHRCLTWSSPWETEPKCHRLQGRFLEPSEFYIFIIQIHCYVHCIVCIHEYMYIYIRMWGSNDRWWPSPHSPQRSRCCEPACEERQKQRISLFCCQRTRYSPSIPNNRLEPLSNFRRSNMKQKPSISMQLP